MKYITSTSFSQFSFILIFLFLQITACNPSDEPEEFPQLYKYQQLDFETSKYYVLTSNSYNEINAGGSYISYDEILEEELDIFSWEFEIEQIELLDENSLRVYFFDYLNITPADTIVNYSREGDKIVLDPQLGGNFVFYKDSGANATRVALKILQHSKKINPNFTDYSPIDIAVNESEDIPTIISQRRAQYNLQAGDTIALNFSSYLYPKQ
ncbi:MAG: hypothetical protein IT262_19220 [Saprospiraceae bacterium]|nr:hypothetical protein [Saprospiraceae bacterium]